MHNVWHDRGFRIHLIVYAAVNFLLLVINLLSDRGHLWFYWPLIGWGIALLGHAFLVYRRGPKAVKRAPIPRPPGR
jgi:hypothetical protein